MSNIIKFIISMTIWGSLGVFVKSIRLESFELAFLRAIIACIFLGTISTFNYYKEKKDEKIIEVENKKNYKSLLFLIISGICISFNWAFLFESYKYTTVSNAILSYYFAPVIVVFLSPVILKEKLTLKTAISVLAALCGLFIILNNQLGHSSENFNHIRGITMGLIAACFYASIVMLNRYIQDFNDYKRTFIQLFTASVVLLPFIIYRDMLVITEIKIFGLIILLGIVHTGLAYCLYFSAIKNLKVKTTALLSYIDPISSIVFSVIFLSESLSIYQVIGGSIILISAFLGQEKQKQEAMVES